MNHRLLEISPWIPPAHAAQVFGVPEQTVRSWMRRGNVTSMCLLNGMLLVNWHDVMQRTTTRERKAA